MESNKNQGQEDKPLRIDVECRDRQHECRGMNGKLTCNSAALYGQSSPSPTSSPPLFNKS
jgi:hypothetical protein